MERYRIAQGRGFELEGWDPGETKGFDGGKAEARAELAKLNPKLDALQEKLYANGRHRVLIVLQGMDTSGKGGTIRRVFEGVNPSGVKVTAFKKPTEEELAHDIVRVHELVPPGRWKARYRHIRDFERMLADEGTTILKFFLHISRDEQRERLQARLDDPAKHWKFRVGDLEERKHWDAYMQAFEDAIRETARPHAPWYVVPADRKWYRDLVVGEAIVDALEKLDLGYPPSPDDLSGVTID
jgi:polyphosphate kinase 2 (PPK2 family)